MSKMFILSQDCWRWRLVDRDGEDETELAHSDGTYLDRGDAMADVEKLHAEHPDADLAEDRQVVERIVRPAAAGEAAEAAYQRGYEAAKRELMEKLMGGEK